MNDAKRTYKYKTWGGAVRTVEADKVEFTPHHVAFWDCRPLRPVLVLAEKVENVNHLTDITPDPLGREPYAADGALR